MNDTPLIGLIHKGSHGIVPSKQSGILVPNMLKCYAEHSNTMCFTFRLPLRHSTGCTDVHHGVGEDQPYGVPRHWAARGSPGGSAEAV